MNTENYREKFQNAIQTTQDWGLQQGLAFTELQNLGIDRSAIYAITEKMLPKLLQAGFVDSKSLAGNCIQINSWLAQHLADHGVKSVITMGSMYLEHGFVYMALTHDALKAELDAPSPDEGLKVHAWLTLEDGTIVDWVGPAWYDQFIGSNYPVRECMDVLMHGHFGDSPYRYLPYLVGDEFLRRVGAVRRVPSVPPVQQIQYNINQALHQLIVKP
ncbi:hypothetical protein [Comamonas aquatica]|uniref:hypothetical protein n=1 Tax=Comamonas aquatica TaxID=225991 RepID=UPI00244A0E9E|nr:hypothetical protein [Comamonas aquatica]MDH0380663.1 hypothetical protein [Comamonas aquatica]MDH0429202.1 hypothetical protein [Comamonas aquatica]MDH0940018.1 hypothetical protein [Comamonas aquatica]